VRYNASAAVSFYGNAGTSFLVPSAKQVWGTTSDPSLKGQLPNPDLKEETGRGIDFGIEWRPSETFALGMRWFLNQLDDAIIDNVVSQSPSQTQAVNAGKARSHGGEIMVDHKASDVLTWFANFTYTSSKVENPLDLDSDGTDIPFVPDLVFNAGLVGSIFSEITIIPYLHMVGRYYDSTSRTGRHEFGSYQTANIKIEKTFLEKTGYAVNAFLDLNNITDERFEMPWGFRDPGFNFLVGLEAEFF
jgi:outer membrane receptor protein involved in Fe transport